MKNGDILRGPRSLSSSAVSAMPDRPPIPEPIIVPVAQRSSSVEGCQSASSSAWRAAHIAKMMKSSTLRWSFGSIHWSGLKLPSEPSPRGITQAIRLERSATSRPRPVRLQCAPRGASAFRVLFEKLRRVADGQNRLCGVVGNFATELFFKCHYKLDGVETVRAEVVDETCSVNHLVWFDTEVLDHNLLNPLANLTHRSTSCLFHWTRPQDR